MNEYLPYIVFGLATGSVYGISAMGLVLTYKTSGVFNFAHGAVCAAAAYAFYDLRQLQGLPWPVAAFLAVVVFGTLVGLILERMAVALAGASTTYKIVATVGLLVMLRSLVILRYGGESLFFDSFLPQDSAFKIDTVQVSYENLVNLGLGIVSAVALYLFFRATRLGVAMRGVVDDPALLDQTGESPSRVRRYAWVIGSMFAAGSGVLFASVQRQLDVNILSLLVVQAFGAAAIGLFRSLPMAFVGGLIVGLLQKLAGKEVSAHADLQGIDTNMPFLVLLLVLVVARREQLVEVGHRVKARAIPAPVLPAWTRNTVYLALGAFLLAVPHLGGPIVGTKLAFYNVMMTQIILFLSLSLLIRTSGQISLGHIAFAAIGAAGFAHMLGDGVPWGLAVLIGGLIAAPIGALVALPAIRLSGLYLGLLTLGFNIMLAQYAFGKSFMFGFGGLETRRPDVWGLGSDERYYYLLLAIACACMLLVMVVERSRLGRLLRAMADSPIALTTLGTSVNVSRTIVFAISAFLAGISGALYSSLFGALNQNSFNYLESLIIVAILAISGRRTIPAAIVAAFLYKGMPAYIDNADLQEFANVMFGAVAVLVAVTSQGQLQARFGTWAANARERVLGPHTYRMAETSRSRRGVDLDPDLGGKDDRSR